MVIMYGPSEAQAGGRSSWGRDTVATMYQTRVSSVDGRIVTDENGDNLYRIGNMPVAVGDYVWTDGAAVYGFFMDTDEQKPYIPKASALGIPLWAAPSHNGVYVYTRNHDIQFIRRPTANEFNFFSNHAVIYGMTPTDEDILDMDDDNRGGAWAIGGRASYYYTNRPRFMWYYDAEGAEGTPSGWYETTATMFGSYLEGYGDCFQWEVISNYTYSDEAWPENDRNETTTSHSEYNPTPLKIDFSGRQETLTDNAFIMHNGQKSQLSIQKYLDQIRREWYALAASFGSSSMFAPFLTFMSASIGGNMRIDDKGNPYFVVYATADGYAFRDAVKEGFSVTTNIEHEHKQFRVVTIGTGKRNTRFSDFKNQTVSISGTADVCTLMASVSVSMEFVVDAGAESVCYKSASWGIQYQYNEVDLGDQYAQQGPAQPLEGTKYTYGSIVGIPGVEIPDYTQDNQNWIDMPKTPSNKPQMSYSESWERDYYLPIQDGYTVKNGDFWTVYRGGAKIMDNTPFPVGGVVDVDGKSYLIIPMTGGRVALYRDGQYTTVGIDGHEFGVLNTRLRYINSKAALMKEWKGDI